MEVLRATSVWICYEAHNVKCGNRYIIKLIYASVDFKTVRYLELHENSKIIMDVYAKAKNNKPRLLLPVVKEAFGQNKETRPLLVEG